MGLSFAARRADYPIHGGVAVITGAAGGIGAALAGALAARGCHLALVDIDETGLADMSSRLARHPIKVSAHKLDVADEAAVAALPASVMREHGRVNLLVNNAGVALGGAFERVAPADFDWLFSINFFGVVRMTRAFLPLLQREAESRIVNLSSVFGLIGPPGQTAYAASKFAVRGFSEALRQEVEADGVGVSVVHPAGVRTDIATHARKSAMTAEERAEATRMAGKFLFLAPEIAAERILRGVERRQDRILVGADAHRIDLVQRLFPAHYARIFGWLIARDAEVRANG